MKLTVELQLAIGATPDVQSVTTSQTGWKFTAEQPDGELYYRTKLTGGLTVQGAEFAWLHQKWKTQICCAEIWVNVFRPLCSADDGGDEQFWLGYFTLDDVKWDFTNCKAEVGSIQARDAYDALYRVWTNPVNVLQKTAASGEIGRINVVALYDEYPTWQPNANGQLELKLPDGNNPGTGYGGREHDYTDALPLMPFLTKLAIDTTTGTSAATIGAQVVSEFYTAAINPVTKRTNNQRAFMAGSDAKRPDSLDDADILTVTLKEMLDELKSLHNVYHCIDPQTGLLRIEHYSWFAEQSYVQTKRISVNLLAYPDALAKANNESTDLDGLFGYEELRIDNNSGSRHAIMKVGSVKYDGACAVRDDKGQLRTNTLPVRRIFTDLEAAYRQPDTVPEDSILLLELVAPRTDPAVQSGYYQIASAVTRNYTNAEAIPFFDRRIAINDTQSPGVLFVDYHLYGRSYVMGRVNSIKQPDGSYSEGSLMYMLSRRPTRRQENIVIPICCEDLPFNLRGYIRTNRFDRSLLKQAVFDVDNATMTISVVTDSRCQGFEGKPPDPGSDCPAAGTLLRQYVADNYIMPDGTVLYKAQVTEFADGNCGSIPIAFPYIPPIDLPPVKIPG